jgi:hypothetical protein
MESENNLHVVREAEAVAAEAETQERITDAEWALLKTMADDATRASAILAQVAEASATVARFEQFRAIVWERYQLTDNDNINMGVIERVSAQG